MRARLYLRAAVATLGIAPFTSMFQFGENQPHRTDFRPEVHDSDGLMVATGSGEWIWRPLINPKHMLVTSFAMSEPARLRPDAARPRFASYEDPEARYELRPSAWVEPDGSWGPGRVELVQIPTPDETNDNIVAYWVPDQVPPPGQPLDFSYRMHWQLHNRETAARRLRRADARGPRLSRARRRRAAVHRRLHRAHRSTQLPADAPGEGRRVGARQRRDRGVECLPRRGDRPVAHDGPRQAARSHEADRAARLSAKWERTC